MINSLPINPDRICDAIARIGYNPTSAIMDVIDNSFMADATKISVKIILKDSVTLNNPKNIERIFVVDNGKGMTEDGIKKALELGSDVEYGNNSLSKYGLGLKSAGFSLGRRIEVVSKVKGSAISQKFFLDRDLIKKEGVFGYANEDADETQKQFLESPESGTVISFHDLIYTSRVSASKLMEDLMKKAGVVYAEFLDKPDVSFNIQVFDSNSTLLKENEIKSKDILFWNDAYQSFNQETYDCKRNCRVLDTEFENPINPTGEKIKIQATIFPKDSMKTFTGFTAEEKARIKEYDVSLTNSGFYFYRNGRLIKWGAGLFLNRELGIRVRVSFSTEHDELFDVDVSKQHLTISEEVDALLRTLIAVPRSQSKTVFEMCDILVKSLKQHETEGAEFNTTNSTLEEDEDESVQIDPEEKKKRKSLIEDDSKDLELQTEPRYEDEEQQEGFRRVRYWDGNKNRTFWDVGMDSLEGSYVLIDKNHPFYDLVLNNLEVDSPLRQSFEALLHSLAVGQNQTVQKFADVDGDVVLNIFKKFLRSSSQQLDNWVNNNWNLFNNEG
ncbi:ATP-binding protein [Fluviicola sp.]|uniref:ATP-binding protein n=1 Tax=Fluviicola sp. TaxID=1917219 RepID=UPI0031E25F2C